MKTESNLQRGPFFSISRLNTKFNQLSDRSISLVRKSAFLVCIGLLGFNSWGQIAQRGTATTATSTTTSVTVAKPTGLAVGDLLIATINQADNDDNSLSDATSTGWQLVGGAKFYTSGSNEWWGTVLYKIATSSDVSASNFTFQGDSDANDMQASIIAFSGVDQTNPIDIAGTFTSSTDNNSSLSANGITTTSNNAAVIMLAMISDNRSFNSDWSSTSPSSLSELFDVPFDADLDMGIAGAWAIKSTAGETGIGSVTLSGNARDGAILIALKPYIPGGTYTTTFTSNGTFTVPSCVSSLTVEAWGGGGGGFNGNSSGGGKGGGGGAYAKGTINNASGNYTVTVGVGGGENTDGTASTFGSTLVVANGGGRGANQTTSGGAGGTASTSGVTNPTTSNGGNGGNGNNTDDVGGGGGGAGGPDGAGINGANGASNVGGNGGNGNNSSGGNGGTGGNEDDGNDGSDNALGGGGGGGGDNEQQGGDGGFPGGGGGGGENGGGQGADGLVRVTYSLPNNPTITLTNTTASACFSASAQNVTLAYSTTTGCPNQYSIDFTSGITDVTDANLSGSPITITLPAGLAVGIYNGTLTVKNSTYGFVSNTYSIAITVTAANTAGTASSNPTLCINTALTNITRTTTGATGIGTATGLPAGVTASWASNVITISGTPTASGTFNYSIPLTGGCGSVNATGTITVTAAPSAGTLSGTQAICSNGTTTLASTVSGGAWSSSNTAVATINSSGVVTGVAIGSATMTYTVTGTGGCANATATREVTVSQPTTSITIDGTTIGNGDYLWNGNINSNGNVSGNWYVLNNGIYSVANQVPQENHEVFVVSSSQAVSCVSSDLTIPNSGNFRSDNIYIGQNANVTLGNNASINVRGNFVNDGNINAGNGLVNFTGNSAVQIIRGTGALNFSNVRIAKSQGVVRLSNDISVSGALDFEQGNLDLNGKTLNYSGGFGISTSNGGLIGSVAQSKLNLTDSSQITDGLFQNGEIYDLTIGDSAGVSSSGSYTILHSLTVGNGATFTKEDGYTIIFKGNLVNNGEIIAGTSGDIGSLIFNNTIDQTISGQQISVAKLEINKNTGFLTISAPVTVTDTLKMTKGDIVNSALITIGTNSSNPGSISHNATNSGRITGALRRYFPSTPGSSAYFPVGNTSNTRGATIAFTSSPGANQYLTVKYQGGAAGGTAPLYTGLPLTTGDGVLIQNFDEEGYWEINPTANDYTQSINTTPYTITLQMKNLSNVNDRSTVRIIKAAGSNNQQENHRTWSALTFGQSPVIGNSNSDFTVTGTSTGFSWFGAGSGNNNPLPVELVSFSGLCEEGVVNLTWQTASEFNSSHFNVEKSRDGENWQLLSTVPSAGTSNELITYQAVDKNGTNGNNYYRLHQVDIDGTEKVYDPINVSCVETTAGYFTSYPNPSGDEFQVVVNNKEILGACTLNIVDAQGKVIDQRSIEVKDGINMFVITESLNPGIYFLSISTGSKTTQVIKHAVK